MTDRRADTVAIIGGGIAGVTAARRLERRLPADWRVLLLSRESYLTFNPLLAEVVETSILPGHVVAPIRQMVRRAQFRLVIVDGVDLAHRRLHTGAPEVRSIPRDHLVLACGMRANLDPVPAMAAHGSGRRGTARRRGRLVSGPGPAQAEHVAASTCSPRRSRDARCGSSSSWWATR